MYWYIEEIDETGFGEMVYEPAAVRTDKASAAQDASTKKEGWGRAFEIHFARAVSDGQGHAILSSAGPDLRRESSSGVPAPA
jgi:hypothetical protein